MSDICVYVNLLETGTCYCWKRVHECGENKVKQFVDNISRICADKIGCIQTFKDQGTLPVLFVVTRTGI